MPRCIKPRDFGQLISAQLHHFSEASEDGYGTVSYLRLHNEQNQVHLAFVLGKARVAPVKKVTIPRMELTAAMLAVRVERMLKLELQLNLESSGSHIYKLDPMVKSGLLRVGGRLSKAVISDDMKHPVIVAKDQPISTLILNHIHEQLGHCGRNHLLSRLCQHCWITSANAAARRLLSSCVICRC